MFGSCNTTLIISNDEMNGIMKIVKSPEESGSLIIGVSKKLKMKRMISRTKKQKGGFHGMLLGTLGASLLGNL